MCFSLRYVAVSSAVQVLPEPAKPAKANFTKELYFVAFLIFIIHNLKEERGLRSPHNTRYFACDHSSYWRSIISDASTGVISPAFSASVIAVRKSTSSWIVSGASHRTTSG